MTDLDLNETGMRQAREVAAYLSKKKIDAVYSSNLKRAIRTAEVVGQPHNLTVTVENSFRELHHGELEGLTYPEIRATYADFFRKWRNQPAELFIPGGERLIDVEKRVWDAMNRLIRHHRPNEAIAIVSHNFPMLTILCRITGTPLNNYRSFHLDPCGVNHISYTCDDGWRITEINYRGYHRLV